jgi:hypothetical protein
VGNCPAYGIESPLNNRIGEADFTRGMLVLFMVIYHSLNYLGYESIPHCYLLFVPTSFIMIAGFIITRVYVPKYGLTSRNVVSRLTWRSCKLLLLFTLMNVGAAVAFSSPNGGAASNLDNFIKSWPNVYITGGSRWAAFEVLLPIGYLLFLSIPILRFQSLFPYGIGVISLATVAACLAMEYYGYPAYNLSLISAGTIGMTIGLLPGHKMNTGSCTWIMLGFLYILYWCSFLLFGDKYIIQIFSTLIHLLIIYKIGSRIGLSRWLPEQTLLLGRYSLMAYIVQIFYLQLFKRSPLYGDYGVTGAVGVILSVAILTWGTILMVDRAREGNTLVDRAYRLLLA